MPLINTGFDPVAFMQSKGFSANQETSPTYGFSGTFTPEIVFGHWCASAPGSDTSSSAVRNHHYHSCTNRAGHTRFGGYRKRQAHGGWGRTTPITEARRGQMNAAAWDRWCRSPMADNTKSQPNQYGMSAAIDCTIDESISQHCVDAWLATMAMWLTQSGMHAGYAMHHAVSTDRKIDVVYLVVEGKRWGLPQIYDRLAYWVAQFSAPPPPVPPTPPTQENLKMYAQAQWPGAPAKPDAYAIVKPDGGVYTFGGAPFYGSAAGHILPGQKATDLCWTPTGKGYWLISSDGGVFTFGDAPFKGSIYNALPAGAKLNAPCTNISCTPTGQGYRVSSNDGGLFCFGDAKFMGNVLTVDQAAGRA